jgi:acyl-CoA thioester hydrolase
MQAKTEELIPEGAFETKLNVRWTEMDANGHVSNMYYQSYFDQARMNAFAACGVDLAYLREHNVGPVIFHAELEYRKELFFPDTALIYTYGLKVERSRGRLRQVLVSERSGQVVCVGTFDGIFMDLVRKRPTFFPEALRQNLTRPGSVAAREETRVLGAV